MKATASLDKQTRFSIRARVTTGAKRTGNARCSYSRAVHGTEGFNRRYVRSGLNSIKLIAGRRLLHPGCKRDEKKGEAAEEGQKKKRREKRARDALRTDSPPVQGQRARRVRVNSPRFFPLAIFLWRAWHSCLYPPIPIRDVNAVISRGNYWGRHESNAFERRERATRPAYCLLPTVLPWNYPIGRRAWKRPGVFWINVSGPDRTAWLLESSWAPAYFLSPSSHHPLWSDVKEPAIKRPPIPFSSRAIARRRALPINW